MKIIMFSDTFYPETNGIVTALINHSRALAKRGHKIWIFTAKHKKKINLGKNIRIRYFSATNLLIKYPDLVIVRPSLKIIKEINKIKPDILHVHIPTMLCAEAIMYSKIYNIPIIGTYHTQISEFTQHFSMNALANSIFIKNLTYKYGAKFYNSCNVIICPSNIIKKQLKKYGVKKPITVISNGIDLKKFYPIKTKKIKNSIVYVGRVSYEKHINLLIDAIKYASKSKNLTLHIIGGGPDFENLKNYVKKQRLNKVVKFLGFKKHENLINYYNKYEIFAIASTVETECLVILEAMACSLPVIGVNKLAIPELVKNNKNGLISKSFNGKGIADCILKLIDNQSLRNRMGKKSLNLVKSYSLDNTVDKLERLYKDIYKK